MVVTQNVKCPYCGTAYESSIDVAVGLQQYIEDCYICSSPIRIRTQMDGDGNLLMIEILREND